MTWEMCSTRVDRPKHTRNDYLVHISSTAMTHLTVVTPTRTLCRVRKILKMCKRFQKHDKLDFGSRKRHVIYLNNRLRGSDLTRTSRRPRKRPHPWQVVRRRRTAALRLRKPTPGLLCFERPRRIISTRKGSEDLDKITTHLAQIVSAPNHLHF